MKTMMRILALALCLMFIFPAALAQEGTYRLNEPTEKVFADAFAAGKLITGEVSMDLALNAQALGLSEEDAAMAAVGVAVLRQAKITVGAGMTDDALRITLGGTLANDAQSVGVSALADVNLDGVAVESDVIPGKRLSMKWETLLALCGVPQSDIEMIMSLRDVDVEALIAQLLPMVEEVVNTAVTLTAPYLMTIGEFISGLPTEVRENLAEEDYPVTAKEISVTFTQKDLGTLLTKLCDQLENDAAAQSVIDMLIAQTGEQMTVAQLLPGLRSSAAEMDDVDTPITVYVGMDEAGTPLYVELFIYNEPTAESIYAGFFCYPDPEYGWVMEIVGGLYDAENNPTISLYIPANYWVDPADENVNAATFAVFAYEGENALIEMEFYAGVEKSETGELAYIPYSSYSAGIALDGETVQVVSNGEGYQRPTEAGGEYISSTSTVDTYAAGMTISQSVSLEAQIDPTADGGVTGYYKVSESMPASGIDKFDMNIVFASADIDAAASAALEQLALETVSSDEMDALMDTVMTVLTQEKLPILMNVLPPEVVQAMNGAQ